MMTQNALRFGIPDVELSCTFGLTINPSSFAGHELVVVFCPTDPVQAARSLSTYRQRIAEFVDHDAWILVIGDPSAQEGTKGPERVLAILDPDQHAWLAFRNLTDRPEAFDRETGATYFFTRGGNLHRFWHGPAHIDDVLSELRETVG
jgi:hypothetical protein